MNDALIFFRIVLGIIAFIAVVAGVLASGPKAKPRVIVRNTDEDDDDE